MRSLPSFIGVAAVDWLVPLYPWTKALHIISVIAWMAGMLYLPRLFVYHCGAEPGSKQSEDFKVMERKLLRGIINPSMFATFILGGILLGHLDPDEWYEGWLHAKLAFILILLAYHVSISRWRKDFETDKNKRSASFYRWMNEVPAVLMVGIVVLVVVRPI